jgi:hypothetical protein
MTVRICGYFVMLAAATTLAACASAPSDTSSAAPVAAAPAAAVAKKSAGTGTGYRLVSRNGEELYCRKEQATGSLTRSRDLCITAEQMEARSHHDQALHHDLTNAPNATQANSPSP